MHGLLGRFSQRSGVPPCLHATDRDRSSRPEAQTSQRPVALRSSAIRTLGLLSLLLLLLFVVGCASNVARNAPDAGEVDADTSDAALVDAGVDARWTRARWTRARWTRAQWTRRGSPLWAAGVWAFSRTGVGRSSWGAPRRRPHRRWQDQLQRFARLAHRARHRRRRELSL